MAMTNKLLLSQIACYAIACILSLCIIIPMTLHQDQFKGHCLLFSTGVWQEADGQFLVSWASQAYCNYTIFVGVVLFVVSMIQIYRMYMYIHRDTDSSFLSAFVDVIGCLFLCTLTIIAALMITLGFMTWCENMTERFPSCELAAGQAIDKKDGINTDWFHVELGAAQFGVWASFSCWVALAVCSLLKLCSYHQIQNMRVSMYRERQNLISETLKSQDNVNPQFVEGGGGVSAGGTSSANPGIN
uniref:Transmembrane protein 179 n=1 Tax=Cacopsylla melanoneura TaxID=428564 RepID=A0A8D8ZED9_9HEMI